MSLHLPKFTLENGLDLRLKSCSDGAPLSSIFTQLQTTGSVLHINEHYDESDYNPEPLITDTKNVDFIGKPLKDFTTLAGKMTDVDQDGFVKKLVLEQGGGTALNIGCTVSVAFSGYWEAESEPFDVMSLKKPMEVDLKDHGLLPGLDIAIKSMLVGELSAFLFSHEVMYGEFGIPPRIKPKAQCVFYIKLIKSVLTPQKGRINYSEPNMFGRVHHEAKLLYSTGILLYQSSNISQAIRSFKKAELMLHRCRLADEQEEKIQAKLLKKLYINLAVCYNKVKQPLKTCTACNELHRLQSLWNNGKALFQNAKALRMIGSFDSAECRLKRAMKYFPDSKEMKAEMELLIRTRDSCNQAKLISKGITQSGKDLATDDFKREVDNLIKNFKENVSLCKLTMPAGLNSNEMAYVKEACIRENLFFNKVPNNYVLETDEEKVKENAEAIESTFALDKEDIQSSSDGKSEASENTHAEIHQE